MNRSDAKTDIESSFGSMLTEGSEGRICRFEDFGSFSCSVENFEHFSVVRRNFETDGETLSMPFSCHENRIEMIFSLDGQSAFNDRSKPYLLSPTSHCINLSKPYECQNLLDETSCQQDITFRLTKNFYGELISNHLATCDDRLPAMILHDKAFNTINQHIPSDAGILGLLKNIIECPFNGSMKSAFIREHVRALLTLQLFHFSAIITGEKIKLDGKITKRDEDVLHEVKNYLDTHFLEPASIDTLSKHFGINDFKLKHGFKVLFDSSPMRYLQYKRLEHSLFLLRETDTTIKKIADQIGYTHAANFTTAFTKTFGKSPLHYRK